MKKHLIIKRITIMILIVICINAFYGCTSLQQNMYRNIEGSSYESIENEKDKNRVLNYDEVKDSLIRFHVIANSDSEEDQKLKIEVKNKIIDYLYPFLNTSESLEDSRQIIISRMQEVKKIADEVIQSNNYKYRVKVELSRENFPDKSYGNITLPQGNYEAFRVIIGGGQGKNWWCVMFPPLCFVDESKAEVEYDKTEAKIKEKENKFEINKELNLDGDQKNDQDEIVNENNNLQIKFKIVEVFRKVFNLQ